MGMIFRMDLRRCRATRALAAFALALVMAGGAGAEAILGIGGRIYAPSTSCLLEHETYKRLIFPPRRHQLL